MRGELRFVEIEGIDAATELEAMLDDPQTYDAAWKLYEHLLKTVRHADKHRSRVKVWKPFVHSDERTYPVYITATDPFVVYLVAKIAETGEGVVLAVLFGRFTGEPAKKFEDRVWAEAERRLRLYKW